MVLSFLSEPFTVKQLSHSARAANCPHCSFHYLSAPQELYGAVVTC